MEIQASTHQKFLLAAEESRPTRFVVRNAVEI